MGAEPAEQQKQESRAYTAVENGQVLSLEGDIAGLERAERKRSGILLRRWPKYRDVQARVGQSRLWRNI
jgi:hypothetical protein